MKLFAAYRLRPIPSEFGFHNPVMEEEMGIVYHVASIFVNPSDL